MTVAQEALYSLQTRNSGPMADAPVPARPPVPSDPSLSSTAFPLLDVTELPDNHPSVPQGPQQYDSQYMDCITCWAQTQPSHVETSVPLQAGVSLFPPQEVHYPTYVNFQAAIRLLSKHKSRKRLAVLKKLMRANQDKYQLRTWDHRKGE